VPIISEMTSTRNPTGHVGLLSNFSALASALTEFFAERAALFTQESRAALLATAHAGSVFDSSRSPFPIRLYFLIASAVVGVAYLAGISWTWTALAAAGTHFVIALILLLIARNRITEPFFRATLTELKKDREWLKI
jgi:Putative Actinobacterial Holin-X, holin superfamily III